MSQIVYFVKETLKTFSLVILRVINVWSQSLNDVWRQSHSSGCDVSTCLCMDWFTCILHSRCTVNFLWAALMNVVVVTYWHRSRSRSFKNIFNPKKNPKWWTCGQSLVPLKRLLLMLLLLIFVMLADLCGYHGDLTWLLLLLLLKLLMMTLFLCFFVCWQGCWLTHIHTHTHTLSDLSPVLQSYICTG